MRIIHAHELVKSGDYFAHRREVRTVQVNLSGRWLERLGFKPGDTVYIYEGAGEITVSLHPPMTAQVTPLEQIKADFVRAGIPITRQDKRHPSPASQIKELDEFFQKDGLNPSLQDYEKLLFPEETK